MPPTKKRLTENISSNLNLPKRQSAVLVENLFEWVKSTLAAGDDLLITGFAKFFVLEQRPRTGRNPQSGGELYLDSRRVVRFRPSGVLRRKLNGNK